MGIHFLRGTPQAPKGHAILIARSTSNPRVIYGTYCVVPPIAMSLAKYLPPLFAAQFPTEELGEATNFEGMPIPPMLEEVESMEYVQMLAQHRDDDLCDIGTVSPKDEARIQIALLNSREYGQLYAQYISSLRQSSSTSQASLLEPTPLDDLDTEELLLQALPDRQKLAELGKLVGTARYALEGKDILLAEDTRRRMQQITRLLPEKYRGKELIAATFDPRKQGAKLAELYISRAYKLLDEEYADIPRIEQAIRDLQN